MVEQKVTNYELARAQVRRGYNLSVFELADYLKASTRWINENITPFVAVKVRYEINARKDYEQFRKLKTVFGNPMSNGVYLSEDDVNELIRAKYRYEVKTEVIDMYSYLEGNPKGRAEVYKTYKEEYSPYRTGFGRLPKNVLKQIHKDFHKEMLENLSVKKHIHKDGKDYYEVDKSGRNDTRCVWTEYPESNEIDIFRSNIYFLKNNLTDEDGTMIKAGEHIARYAFLHGDIRLKFGEKDKNKVIFIKNSRRYKDFKMPFTVPYGISIGRY